MPTDKDVDHPGPDAGWLAWSYDEFPKIEEAFGVAVDQSLAPRGPDLLFELVGAMGISTGSTVVDVGCGDGRHSIRLAEQLGCRLTGIDPVAGNIDAARRAVAADDPDSPLATRIEFAIGSADALPVADASVDLVWCRDVLVHVPNLVAAFGEFRRVLRPGGRVCLYVMVATDLLEPREARWLWTTMGIVPASADPVAIEAALADVGLRTDERIVLGTEWGEWTEERTGANGRRLLRLARLRRDPQRYIARFGRPAYEMMLGDGLWHIYAMIGKLERRVYLLSKD
jgi:SAM-dependent methyltransferase